MATMGPMASAPAAVVPMGGWATEDLQQVHTLPAATDVTFRALRALKALVEARLRPGRMDPEQCKEEARALQDALRPTAFGQAIEPGLLTRLLPSAEYTCVPAESHIELRGPSDALYVLLTGTAEVLRGPSVAKSRWLTLTCESASDLQGDNAADRLDPYVIVSMGGKQHTSPVAMDAGSDPVFNWTINMLYSGEPRISFSVMEHDQYSRHDLLGTAIIDAAMFEKDGYEGSVMLSANAGEGERKSITPITQASFHLAGQLAKASAGSLKIRIAWSSEPALGASIGADGMLRSSTDAPGAHDARLYATAPPASALMQSRAHRASPQSGAGGAQLLDRKLQPGQYFGMGSGGGALRTLEVCQLLLVPRAVVNAASKAHRAQCAEDRHRFLRKHLPGGQNLDSRIFDHFAASFQQSILPQKHVLCKAGETGLESRRVYMLKRGTCTVLMPSPSGGRDFTAGPLQRAEEVMRAQPPALVPMGQVGEGALIGYASALFGLPEPFTAIANEPVTVLWISVADRPMTNWPKDVVARLHDTLRARTDLHLTRRSHLAAMPATLPVPDHSEISPQEVYRRNLPEWKVADSRFLRNKELSAWRAETIRDLYDAEGWDPKAAGMASTAQPGGGGAVPTVVVTAPRAGSPTGAEAMGATWGGRSTLAVGARGLLQESRSDPGLARPSSSSSAASTVASTVLSRPGSNLTIPGGGARGLYNINSGIGRCKTPWGTWSPSGMLPPASPVAGPAEKFLQRAKARKKVVPRPRPTRRTTEELSPEAKAAAEGDAGERERGRPEHPAVNLRCARDWQRISAVASPGALEKMYRRQVRSSAVVAVGPRTIG